jgi:hypothetical protein
MKVMIAHVIARLRVLRVSRAGVSLVQGAAVPKSALRIGTSEQTNLVFSFFQQILSDTQAQSLKLRKMSNWGSFDPCQGCSMCSRCLIIRHDESLVSLEGFFKSRCAAGASMQLGKNAECINFSCLCAFRISGVILLPGPSGKVPGPKSKVIHEGILTSHLGRIFGSQNFKRRNGIANCLQDRVLDFGTVKLKLQFAYSFRMRR